MPDFPLIGSLVIKKWIATDKIPRKLHWNGQGLQQVVEKGDKLSNFCDEIGGNGFLKEQGFVFLMERLQQRASPFYSSPSILNLFLNQFFYSVLKYL